MQQVENSFLEHALDYGGYDLVSDMLSMSAKDIDDLTYILTVKDEDRKLSDVNMPLHRARCSHIRSFQSFINYMNNEGIKYNFKNYIFR